ncbi:MAG: cytochrome P450 [Alphaproteobacteria bacterium]|nr:cytochrome P450 [Alphaproteobacteria bacterium]
MSAGAVAERAPIEAPEIVFERAHSSNPLVRWFGLLPKFDLMRAVETGPVCWTRLLGKRIYFVSDPEAIKHVLLDRVENYPKSVSYRNNLKPFLGTGLLVSEGDFWRRQRRLAQPAFHHKRLRLLVASMAETAWRMVERWSRLPPGAAIDVMAEMNAVTMEVVTRTMFGADLTHEIAPVAQAMTTLQDEVGSVRLSAFLELPEWMLKPRSKRFREALGELDRVVNGLIAARRSTDEERDDLLSMLISARDEQSGEGMTDRQLRDEVMTIFLAGHETTALGLSWAFHLLGRHPEERVKLEVEVDDVLAGRQAAFEDLAKLSWTRMVGDEALRLFPPAYVFGRRAQAEDVVLGYRIPRGAHLMISPYAMHRHPRYWDRPEAFRPERFTPEAAAARPRYVYMPFGGGPRICIGNSFAQFEMQVILAAIAARFRLDPIDPAAPVEAEPRITLRIKGGLPMRLTPRASVRQAA